MKSSLLGCGVLVLGVSACAGEAPREIEVDAVISQAVTAPDPNAVIRDFDAAVFGASEGGIAAAITIARQGRRVALVDELDYIGGMSAAGTTSMDGNFALGNDPGHEADFVPLHPGYESGFYKEFADNVRAYYHTAKNKHVSTCYSIANTVCFEPSVGRLKFKEMLDAAGVTLFLNETPKDVVKVGNVVKGFETKNQTTNVISYFRSKVSLDGSDYGDLLSMTGARYRVGKSYSTNINTAACVSHNTYGAVIRNHNRTPGIPPLAVADEPTGYTDLQTFEIVWWVPSAPPATPTPVTMSPKDYFGHCIAPGGSCTNGPVTSYPINFLRHTHYRGMPDSNTTEDFYNGQDACSASYGNHITKTDINWFNDAPQTVGGIENRTTRKTENCNAKLRTIQFLYYLQNAQGMYMPSWSVASDEGFSTTYNNANLCSNIPPALKEIEKRMPLAPYVRESRRMVGTLTLNAAKVLSLRDNRFADVDFLSSMAFADYGFDIHGCWDNSTMDPDQGESFWGQAATGDMGGGPATVPFGALIPETVDGFLPATGKLISVSRVANGKYRHQPISMLVGQAAGAIAAQAIASNIPPRQINVRKAQIALLAGGAQIVPFTDVDNAYVYRQEANLMALNQFMIGYPDKRFGINDPITRAQAAVVTTKAAQLPLNPISNGNFADVLPTHWAFDYVEALKDAAFTAGCGGNNYCPDASLVRSHGAVFAIKTYEKLHGMPIVVPGTFVMPYTDVPTTHFAYDYIKKLAYLGVILPCGGVATHYCPDVAITRGEASFVFASTLNLKQAY